MSNSPSRSRGAFLRPGFETLASRTRNEGWRSAGSRRVLARHPWPALGGRRRLGGGALRPSAWDARLPALSPWRFWAGRARFPHRTCVRIGQRAPRTRGVVPEGEVSSPVASGCEPLPRDATPRSVLRIVSRARPLLSKAGKILATLRKLRSRNVKIERARRAEAPAANRM